MAGYRLYSLDGTGRITGAAQVIEAPSDEEALALVRAQAESGRFELWHGRRLVGRAPDPTPLADPE